HYCQSIFRESHCLLVTGNTAAEIAIVEKANVSTNPFTLERTASQKLRVIIRQRLPGHGPERRLHGTQQNRYVRHAARHWTGRVLLMADRHDSILRDEPERRLQAKDVFNRRWTGDRTVSLSANRCRAQTCRSGGTRAGA